MWDLLPYLLPFIAMLWTLVIYLDLNERFEDE